jgi:5'-methylthioadenosine phosphorylase
MEPLVGVIGGSGLYELEGLRDVRWRRLRTPFGDPSDEYCCGRLDDHPVAFLARHGRGHRLMPTELNFRANIWGLKALGAEWVISVSAVGSMREAIKPLDLVVPDQFFDATKRRVSSFFGDGIVAHVGMAEPVCADLATTLEKAARQAGGTLHRGGTYLCIEGPQFSTKAESRIYRSWGVDVIGMTNMPEAKLAREAELCYATLALATDYDVWHDTHEAVTVEAVVHNLLTNVAMAKAVLRRAIPMVAAPPHLSLSRPAEPGDHHQPEGVSARRPPAAGASHRQVRHAGRGHDASPGSPWLSSSSWAPWPWTP